MTSEENKTENEFKASALTEPRPRHSALTDISLYKHPLSAATISEEDECIEIGDINGSVANTVLIENTCTFTELDSSYYKLAAEDIDRIRIRCINTDMCNVILYPERGNDIIYLIKTHLYITILKNTVIINTRKYWTDDCIEVPYKCILDYL